MPEVLEFRFGSGPALADPSPLPLPLRLRHLSARAWEGLDSYAAGTTTVLFEADVHGANALDYLRSARELLEEAIEVWRGRGPDTTSVLPRTVPDEDPALVVLVRVCRAAEHLAAVLDAAARGHPAAGPGSSVPTEERLRRVEELVTGAERHVAAAVLAARDAAHPPASGARRGEP